MQKVLLLALLLSLTATTALHAAEGSQTGQTQQSSGSDSGSAEKSKDGQTDSPKVAAKKTAKAIGGLFKSVGHTFRKTAKCLTGKDSPKSCE